MDAFLLFSVLAISVVVLSADKCDPWRNVVGNINRRTRTFDISCHQNTTECSRWGCSGVYKIKTNIASFVDQLTSMEVDYCFGLSFHACHNPPSFNIFLQVPNKNHTFVKNNIRQSDTVAVEGLEYSVWQSKRLAHAKVFLELYYNRINTETVMFGVKSKVEVHYLNDLFQEFVPQLERRIVPYTNFTKKCLVSYPDFNRNQLPECIPLNASVLEPVTVTHAKTITPPVIKSKTYGKECDMADPFNACSENEMCVFKSTGKKTTCLCMEEYSISSTTGLCAALHPATEPVKVTTDANKNPDSSTSSHKNDSSSSGHINKTALIIGCVVGGLVFITIIVIIVAVILKKLRGPRATHELLLTEEEEEPDDAILT